MAGAIPWFLVPRPLASTRAVSTGWRDTAYLAVIWLVVLLVGTPGLGDEGAVSISDMPRYLMDGAFLRDVAANAPLARLRDFVVAYYVRYPALGLGHYAPLTAGLEALAFAALGVSVFSARLAILACMLVAAWAMFVLVRRLHDAHVALAATLLFVTSPFVVVLSRLVLAEVPTLALLLAAMAALQAFRARPTRCRLAALVAAAVLSVYAKHPAVLAFPIYAVELWGVGRARPDLRRAIGAAAGAGAVLLVPMALLTVRLAPSKLALLFHRGQPLGHTLGASLAQLWEYHAHPLVLALAAVAAVAAWRRPGRAPRLFVAWIALFYVGTAVAAGAVDARYTVYLVPALCALAAATTTWVPRGRPRILATTALLLLALSQGLHALATPLRRAEGYEAAARFLVEHPVAPVVLYSASVDSGLLPFFVRAHDPDRRLVVLRADKILATSRMERIVADRIASPGEIYDRLRRFGIRYVVVEDVASDSRALEWLRREVASARFTLLARLPIRSTSERLAAATLSIYEYRDATAMAPGTRVRIDLPLSGNSIDVDLLQVVRTRIR